MDNKENGEVSFEASGKSYTLRYTDGAFIALEEYLDRGIFDIFGELLSWGPKFDAKGKPLPETQADVEARMKKMRLGFCRAVFWAGFHDLHKDVTIEQAGTIMKDIGGVLGVYALIVNGFAAALPDSKGESEARPPKRPINHRK
ncbi:hypothetical protein [Bradyrhizobium sp. AUGA SZCCT0160]|uniref:hypothetical protein n=1 Tax=Bradyrhizobium sp. AUGA SZCCT0160 TaxID=2807662 RepID=UPI001BAB1672|nr:hypothetical protein [Bradyrhizobium sp. AUGA SZCCT0160]MBR1193239.1 hypothetical protein [Bradyrhizobium sp. AUGA SZCCT0160]